MGDISKYYSRSEIECKCGCGMDTMDSETLMIADLARVFCGHSITPSSGQRCLMHNESVGGSPHSQHVLGRAMDLPVKRPKALYKWLCYKFPDRYGFGLYRSFVHVDSRKNKARWNF